jgi:DNA-directed RNA polymerase specialized sigma24 family protein
MAIDRIGSGSREQLTDGLEERVAEHDAMPVTEGALVLREAMRLVPGALCGEPRALLARYESYRTIADAMDIPPGTVASRI